MSEAAGGLRARGPARGELEDEAWAPTGAADEVRLALRSATHGEPDEDAVATCSGD
jgi:hypothetical protein